MSPTQARVLVVPPDPSWPARYEREAERIAGALGPAGLRLHHIGSTAIPGIHAKPVIDVLVEASSLEELDDRSREMERAGFEAMGELGIPGRRYFRRDDPEGDRVCNVHAFVAGCDDVLRHLHFRDYLRAHRKEAEEYSRLKIELANRFPTDIYGYMDGKDAFIQERQKRAKRWAEEREGGRGR